MPRKLVALLAVALLSAAACGGSSDDGDAPAEGDDTEASALTVRATDFEFDPATLEVDAGQSGEISFVNAGNVAHSFTADDIAVDVEAQSGESVKASFTAPDEDTTIEYVCKFHPSMTGEITVGSGAGGGGGGGGGSDEDSADSDSFDY